MRCPALPRLHCCKGSHQGEHRQITVLMTDLVDFTAFVERAGEEAAFALVSHVSEPDHGGDPSASRHRQELHRRRHPGPVRHADRARGRAVAGLPCRARDSATARRRRRRIEAELGVRPELRIGLTTGPVVLGAVDSGESTGVTAHGDIVNLAARLQNEAAPGTVVMSEALLRQVEGMVETESTGLFRFKGKSDAAAGLSPRRSSGSRHAIRCRDRPRADLLYRTQQRACGSGKPIAAPRFRSRRRRGRRSRHRKVAPAL